MSSTAGRKGHHSIIVMAAVPSQCNLFIIITAGHLLKSSNLTRFDTNKDIRKQTSVTPKKVKTVQLHGLTNMAAVQVNELFLQQSSLKANASTIDIASRNFSTKTVSTSMSHLAGIFHSYKTTRKEG